VADNAHNEVQFDDASWTRLARYVAGEGDRAERAATEAWASADAARARALAELTSIWKRTGTLPERPVDVDAAWTAMSRRIANAAGSAAAAPRRGRSRAQPMPRLSPGWALAASLLVLVGGAVLWRELRDTPPAQTASARSFATAPGERRAILLDDSSEVVLGVASRLEIAAGYGSPAREMALTGEALFRVRHDAARPFRVRTPNAVAEDLGTEFTVRSYGAADGAQVVVRSGSVALRGAEDAGTAAVIAAGQTGAVSPAGLTRVYATTDSAQPFAWTRGELVFDGTPLREVAKELERWYDVTFTFTDSLLPARRLSTSFRGDSIGDVLKVIELTFDVRAVREGRTVTIRPRRPQ